MYLTLLLLPKVLCWCALYGVITCRLLWFFSQLQEAMAGGIWAPFKEVVRVVNDAILRKEPNAYYKLESELKKHKPDFLSLLQNPVRSL